MVWLDRHYVSKPDQQVRCPVTDRQVALSACLACSHLIEAVPREAPEYVVCVGHVLADWLGTRDD